MKKLGIGLLAAYLLIAAIGYIGCTPENECRHQQGIMWKVKVVRGDGVLIGKWRGKLLPSFHGTGHTHGWSSWYEQDKYGHLMHKFCGLSGSGYIHAYQVRELETQK